MVIIMNPEATAENIKAVIRTIEDAGLEAKVMDGAARFPETSGAARPGTCAAPWLYIARTA